MGRKKKEPDQEMLDVGLLRQLPAKEETEEEEHTVKGDEPVQEEAAAEPTATVESSNGTSEKLTLKAAIKAALTIGKVNPKKSAEICAWIRNAYPDYEFADSSVNSQKGQVIREMQGDGANGTAVTRTVRKPGTSSAAGTHLHHSPAASAFEGYRMIRRVVAKIEANYELKDFAKLVQDVRDIADEVGGINLLQDLLEELLNS